MHNMELTLVLFTILSQIAVGLTLVSSFGMLKLGPAQENNSSAKEWMFAGVLLLIAMVISLFHLGDPMGAPKAIVHISTSWLSREILFALLFGAGIILSYLVILKNAEIKKVLSLVTALLGLLMIVATGMVYNNPGFPAFNNGSPLVFGLLTALILGPAFSSYFVDQKNHDTLIKVLTVTLFIGLAVNLLIPSIWMAGEGAMQMTGAAYYGSGLFWAQIIGEFGVGLLVISLTKKIPAWLPVLLLAGELLGRIAMFYLAVHASTQIGLI